MPIESSVSHWYLKERCLHLFISVFWIHGTIALSFPAFLTVSLPLSHSLFLGIFHVKCKLLHFLYNTVTCLCTFRQKINLFMRQSLLLICVLSLWMTCTRCRQAEAIFWSKITFTFSKKFQASGRFLKVCEPLEVHDGTAGDIPIQS